MRHVAIVLSAGTGSRMGSSVAKQYMMIGDKPIIYFALKAFQESFVDEIVLVCGADDVDFVKKDIVDAFGFSKVKSIVKGGAERYLSVMNGLNACEDADYIYIHDGARPFVSGEVLHRAKKCVEGYGTAIAAVSVKDTIKSVDNNGVILDTPDRSMLRIIQTPQAFEKALITKAYNALKADIEGDRLGDLKITDDAMVVEHYCLQEVHVFEGDYGNMKVTTPDDLDYMRFRLTADE